jgi:hypothetical protein
LSLIPARINPITTSARAHHTNEADDIIRSVDGFITATLKMANKKASVTARQKRKVPPFTQRTPSRFDRVSGAFPVLILLTTAS